MKKEDIEHLASLARIKLSEDEKSGLEQDLSSIVSYVSEISDLVSDDVDSEPTVGARFNIFRTDEVTNDGDQYTQAILEEMPASKGRFLQVKKILQNDE